MVIQEFGKQDKKLVEEVNHKMFQYKPYPVVNDVVMKFMQSHANTSRFKFHQFWLQHDCDDMIPHPFIDPNN